MSSRKISKSSIGLNEFFSIDWSRSRFGAIDQPDENFLQGQHGLAFPLVLHDHLPDRPNEVQNLENGVHVASIALVSQADVSGFLLGISHEFNFKGEESVQEEVQLGIFDEAGPGIVLILVKFKCF